MSTKTKSDILAERIERIMDLMHCNVDKELQTALADYRRPWSLGRSVNGFTLGEGQEWHRTDGWTEEMLPDGWRPLLLGELEQENDFYFVYDDWHQGPSSVGGEGARNQNHHRRTRRPLPPVIDPYAELKAAFKAGKTIQIQWSINLGTDKWEDNPTPDWTMCAKQYRIKPEPKLVPLGPEDVKCGDVIEQGDLELIIAGKNKKEVKTAIGSYSFEQLQIAWKINRNDGRGFVRCEKEAK